MEHKILFIDPTDDPTITSLIEDLNFKYVSVVKTIEQALVQHSTRTFDLTIVACCKEFDAIGLTEQIIKLKPEHYVVLLLDEMYPEQIKNMVRAGVNGFIARPYTRDKVLKELSKYMLLQKNAIQVDL